MRCGEWKFVQLFQVTWPCPYKLQWKTSQVFFLRNQEADDFETWYTSSGTRVLPIFHMMTLGWPWLFLWQGQICFRMLLQGWKLIQHWVIMYFQVCSYSTYPQHSGERYRTNGPLVRYLIRFEPEHGVTVSFLYWLFDYFLFTSLIVLLPVLWIFSSPEPKAHKVSL